MADAEQIPTHIEFYPRTQAPGLGESHCVTIEPMTDIQQAGWDKAFAAGLSDGGKVEVLVNIPGFSLVRAWFKRNYPLPLHSHNADCLYHVVAGDLRMGERHVGPGDSFFVPADVPYTYRTGDRGVELLEFRHANHINFVNKAMSEAYWTRVLDTVGTNREAWRAEAPPSEMAG